MWFHYFRPDRDRATVAAGTAQGAGAERQTLRQPLRRRRVHGEEDLPDKGAIFAGE